MIEMIEKIEFKELKEKSLFSLIFKKKQQVQINYLLNDLGDCSCDDCKIKYKELREKIKVFKENVMFNIINLEYEILNRLENKNIKLNEIEQEAIKNYDDEATTIVFSQFLCKTRDETIKDFNK